MLSVNTNLNSMIAVNSLRQNEGAMAQAMERLSTGLRINSAADDAAGMQVANRMTAQIRGLAQAVTNGQNAVSMVETAEGGTQEISNMLHRMRELAVASQNGTNKGEDRTAMNAEFAQLQAEINRIGDTTQFNGKTILNGMAGADNSSSTTSTWWNSAGTAQFDLATGWVTGLTNENSGYLALGDVLTYSQQGGAGIEFATDMYINNGQEVVVSEVRGSDGAVRLGSSVSNPWTSYVAAGNDGQTLGLSYVSTSSGMANSNVSFQVGANANETIWVDFGNFTTAMNNSYNTSVSSLSVADDVSAGAAIAALDIAIKGVDTQRAIFGAGINRLNYAIDNLSQTKVNTEAARSRVLDTDYAAETSEMARTQIIAQAGVAMLAQANMQPQSVLALLKG